MSRPPTEEVTKCDGCGFVMMCSRVRGKLLCRLCLNGDVIPLDIEDFAGYRGPLAFAPEMIDKTSLGYGETRPFIKALDRALVKHGLDVTQAEMKEALWAGADDSKHAQAKRWKAEDREGI